MKDGEILEEGETEVVFQNPKTEYTKALIAAIPARVMIAAAMICRPSLLIADEPTTALDAATQESILKLLKKLNDK